jgi:predicted O-linked N-acetylglucosamine transferase (SPINDLY family)
MFGWVKRLLLGDSRRSSLSETFRLTPPLESQPSSIEQSNVSKSQGDSYFDQGKLDEAVACYREAITLNPDHAKAHNNLGGVYREQNLLADAERHFRRAVELSPTLANVHYNLASLQIALGRPIEAMENLAREFEHQPKHYAALAILLHLKQKICDWQGLDEMVASLRRSVLTSPQSAEEIFSPFAFMALPGTTREEQRLCAERWVHAEFQSLTALRSKLGLNHTLPRDSRIAVGYLSADFRDHPVARLMAEVLELHDRTQFHVSAYAYGPDDGSEMRKRLINAFDRFVDISHLSDADAARRIHADRVDILVDLTGFTVNSRSGILALRPAPAQVNYLGYLGTMGASFVDYLIADRFLVPPEHQADYTEKVIYLPNCFQPNDRTRPRYPAPARKNCGLPENAFVFCCFNQPYKITREVFDIWCRLLIAVPNSILWLYTGSPEAERNLKREAAFRNIHASRVIMAPRVRPEQYLARMQCADLFLDTSPYNAGTTCSDALWMALPVVTCVGHTFSARMAGSLLCAIGAPELIADDLEDYFQIALKFATNKTLRETVRARINANRDTAPLFDSKQFTKDLESAYRDLAAHSAVAGPNDRC